MRYLPDYIYIRYNEVADEVRAYAENLCDASRAPLGVLSDRL